MVNENSFSFCQEWLRARARAHRPAAGARRRAQRGVTLRAHVVNENSFSICQFSLYYSPTAHSLIWLTVVGGARLVTVICDELIFEKY